MKMWRVVYSHRTAECSDRQYNVVAEDDDIAGEVGKESLENDENNWDADPSHWSCDSVSQIDLCTGCGGMRLTSAPEGHGKVTDL